MEASRLRWKLILEALIFSLAAFGIALCLIVPVSNWLVSNNISEVIFRFREQLDIILITALAAIIIGLSGVVYPSFYVTFLPPAFALKGNFAFSVSGRRFRTIMMLLQYAITFILLIFVMSAYRQNQYMLDYDTGFEKDKIAVIELSQKQAMNKSEWLSMGLMSNASPFIVLITFWMSWGYPLWNAGISQLRTKKASMLL